MLAFDFTNVGAFLSLEVALTVTNKIISTLFVVVIAAVLFGIVVIIFGKQLFPTEEQFGICRPLVINSGR